MPYKDLEKRKEYHRKYMRTYVKKPEVREWIRQYEKNYRQKPKRKEYMQKYMQSPKFKKHMGAYWKSEDGKKVRKQYDQSPKGKAVYQKYRRTESGKAVSKKSYARRYRELGFVQIIDNPFPREVKIEWHHLNKMLVFPTPKGIHRVTLGPQHKMKCNEKLNKLGFDVGEIISEKNCE